MAQRRPIDVAVAKFYGATLASTVLIWGLVALWVGLTTDRQPIYLNVAFCVTWLISVVLIVAILEYAKRRPGDAYLSWGEAMMGAFVAFFLMFWVWGVVPHQWLTYADNELAWRSDKFLIGPRWGPTNAATGQREGILEFLLPFDLTYQVVQHIIVVVIYGITIVGFVAIWGIWQNRGKVAPDVVPESTYGRPLVREGV